MTNIEKFNLLWLCHATTISENYEEHYYYDASRKDFFYTTITAGNPLATVILNRFDMQFPNEIERDLAEKLKIIDNKATNIIEIPRLTITDRVDIQLNFLSEMPTTDQRNELVRSVDKQNNDSMFILDSALVENDNSASLSLSWDEFKLKAILSFIRQFAATAEIDFQLSTH